MTDNQEQQDTIRIDNWLAEKILEDLGENVYLCYQCVKCTSGCPLNEFFDYTPNQIMRACQLGQTDIALESKTPWLCASCLTCATRCPQGINVTAVMEYLTQLAEEQGLPSQVPEVTVFNKIFLRDVSLLGRQYELAMLGETMLRSGKLTQDPSGALEDVKMGMQMMKRGKISFLPHLAHPARNPVRRTPRDNEMMLYPGCSFHGTAAEFGKSTEAVLEALDLEIVEPEGWICCGSSPGHKIDHHLAVKMPLENLAVIEKMGFDQVAVPCAACFNRFKAAVYEHRRDEALRGALDREMDYVYQDGVQIDDLMDALLDKVGLDIIRARVTRPLTGLKVVPYYGCLLTRMPEVTEAPHPENPTHMDVLLEALGAEVLDWSDKTHCCGGTHSLTRSDIVIKLSGDLVKNARAASADAIAVACPLCHANLDARQFQMQGVDEPMPILYFTQLMAIAFGLDEKAAALRKNLVDPRPVLAALSLID